MQLLATLRQPGKQPASTTLSTMAPLQNKGLSHTKSGERDKLTHQASITSSEHYIKRYISQYLMDSHLISSHVSKVSQTASCQLCLITCHSTARRCCTLQAHILATKDFCNYAASHQLSMIVSVCSKQAERVCMMVEAAHMRTLICLGQYGALLSHQHTTSHKQNCSRSQHLISFGIDVSSM